MAPRTIFLNRYFHPDHSATSQILSDLAFDLARAGMDVTVIASRQIYDAPATRLPARERIGDVDIHRVWTTRRGRASIAGRLLDIATFHVSAAWALWRLARKDDVIVVKTDPPLIGVTATMVARLKGARIVNWLQDLYPEIVSELKLARRHGVVQRSLVALRNCALSRAQVNVAIGEDMAARLVMLGIEEKGVRVIHNWSDDAAIADGARADNPLRKAWALEGKFVVGYSGNLGRAHECETLLMAAEALRDEPGIHFLFIGGGREWEGLRHEVAARGFHNFSFRSYQPREMLPLSLAVPDVHWLSLRPELDGLVLPSKFYGIAAAGRPIIAVASRDSAFGRMIENEGCGYAIAPGDGAKLRDAILALAANPEARNAAGLAARRLLEARFSRRAALTLWRDALNQASA